MNILQPSDDIETSAMDCANLRPDGEYLRPEDLEREIQGSESPQITTSSGGGHYCLQASTANLKMIVFVEAVWQVLPLGHVPFEALDDFTGPLMDPHWTSRKWI